MPYKPIDRKKLEGLARSWSLTALKTLGGIMTNVNSTDRDRIRAAEIILEHGGGLVAPAGTGERQLTSLALEVVHLAPMTREEIAQEPQEEGVSSAKCLELLEDGVIHDKGLKIK